MTEVSSRSTSTAATNPPDAGSTADSALQAVIICSPEAGDCAHLAGGITLIERLYRQLQELPQVTNVVVLKPAHLEVPLPSGRIRNQVNFIEVRGADAWQMLREANGRLDRRCLVIGAGLLIDQRLLEWLARQPTDVVLTSRPGTAPEIAGCVYRKGLEDIDPLSQRTQVAVSSLPTYWEAMHGEVPLHLIRVDEATDDELIWKVLLDHIQRRTQELPSRFFDIPFENRLVRLLAPTSISANQITILTTLLGFVVALLYLEGWLRIGVSLAILVEVLDGVDGKLARMTRTTSKLGEQEHILDFFYENSWYLALGTFLARQHFRFARIGGPAMVAFDLTDNIAYALLDVKWGRSLDNVNPFLQRFRLIAGRRNIYTWIFLPGFFLNVAPVAFAIAMVWAGITATVHVFYGAIEVVRLLRS